MIATLDKAYQGVETLLEVPAAKSISSLKTIVVMVTDKKSATLSSKFLSELNKVKEDLIKDKKDFVKDNVVDNLKDLSEKLSSLNGFFANIDKIFDYHNNEKNCEIKIDDPNMFKLMENLHNCKDILEEITSYLQLWVDAEKSKKDIKDGKFKALCSEEDIISAIKAA